ncbi:MULTISPECIES: hypothetical protein [unclassified Micromonospora]|uniref:hypothetical protein n=1 Tax=unclassified Micromonospora TaxID=2617518 RepID=UPI0033AD5D54
MSRPFKTSDEEFAQVVARCRSWRHVLRELGGTTTSTTGVRRRAEQLQLDTSHFTGQRLWSDEELARAIRKATTWNDVAIKLGTPASNAKRHALRRGVDFAHLDRRTPIEGDDVASSLSPQQDLLRNAGESLAAAWFKLAGCGVGQVADQQPYDLLVVFPSGQPAKVQVKTSRRGVSGGVPCFQMNTRNYLSPTRRTRLPYDEQDVDFFFFIGGMEDMWLVPHARVLGQVHCYPGPEYERYRVRWPA